MNIIMIINSFYPLVGGAERQAQRISEVLFKEGINVKVLTRHHEGLEMNQNLNGINVIRFKVGKIKKLRPVIFLIKTIFYIFVHRKSIDVVHGHSLNAPGLIVGLVKLLFKIPGVAKIAGGGNEKGCEIIRMNESGIIGQMKVRFMSKYIEKFIAISSSIERDLHKVNVNKEKIVYLANGINLEEFKTEEENNYNDNFLYLGRLEKIKGIDILIDAWLNIIEKNPDFPHKLIIAGKGSLEKLIPDNKSIVYLGNISDVKNEIIRNKYFILPSRYEGISNALLEAMALKKIIIASDAGGNTDLIKTNITGYLFKSNDSEKLQESILNAINDENQIEVSENARSFLKQDYDLNKNVMKLIQLYEKII